MKVVKKRSYQEACRLVALMIAQLVIDKHNAVIILATGGTMELVYEELVRIHREWGVDFSQVTTFNLDEYRDLDPSHPQSYRFFMNEKLFQHINILLKNTHLPDGLAEDPVAFCQWYEEGIKKAGGIDLALLGIGVNGHIAFLEPPELVLRTATLEPAGLPLRTAMVRLSQDTKNKNSRFFQSLEEVPEYAISMGIGTIMSAKQIVLLATGESKAEAIAGAIEGSITTFCPASLLQLHQNVTVVVDEAAGSQLKGSYPLELELPELKHATIVKLPMAEKLPLVI